MKPHLIKRWTIIDLYSRHSLAKRWELMAWFTSPYIPPVFSFSFIAPYEPEVSNFCHTAAWDQDTFLWPNERHQICIFDENSPGASVRPESPVGGMAQARVSVRVRRGESSIEIAARILHEMLHAMELDSDQMDGKDRDLFAQYLSHTGSPYLTYFYNPEPYYRAWGTLGQMLLLEYYQYLIKRDLKVLIPGVM